MRSLPSISVRRTVGIAVALVATSLTAQAQGRVMVRVTDVANQQPVGQAQVQIIGTTQLLEQGLHAPEVLVIETFAEPCIGRLEEIERRLTSPLIAPPLGEIDRDPELEPTGTLAFRNRPCAVEQG